MSNVNLFESIIKLYDPEAQTSGYLQVTIDKDSERVTSDMTIDPFGLVLITSEKRKTEGGEK